MANAAALPSSRPARRFAVLTAYTSDYKEGELATRVNKAYAARHAYEFAAAVFERSTADLEGRAPPWVKARLLLNLLDSLLRRRRDASDAGPSMGHRADHGGEERVGGPAGSTSVSDNSAGGRAGSGGSGSETASSDSLEPSISTQTTHLVWIDADAVVLNHARSVESILDAIAAPALTEDLSSPLAEPELVISEDLTPCCIVNTGVLIVRVSEWSRSLWRDVWAHQHSVKFHTKRYHEQSALLKQLLLRNEELPRDCHGPPWHSYRGGPGLKRCAHVAILPRHALNTNQHPALFRGGGRAQPPIAAAVGESSISAVETTLAATNNEARALHPSAAEEPPSAGRGTVAAAAPAFLCGAAAEGRCDFVFHAAGLRALRRARKISKLEALQSALKAHGLDEHVRGQVQASSASKT